MIRGVYRYHVHIVAGDDFRGVRVARDPRFLEWRKTRGVGVRSGHKLDVDAARAPAKALASFKKELGHSAAHGSDAQKSHTTGHGQLLYT